MQITKPNLRSFREDFAQAVKDLEQKYNVQMKLGSISYDSDSFTSRLTVNNKRADGLSPEAVAFKSYARNSFNEFKESDLGRTFNDNGTSYTITGYSRRSRKYSILAKNNSNGKTIKFNERYLLRVLEMIVNKVHNPATPTITTPVVASSGESTIEKFVRENNIVGGSKSALIDGSRKVQVSLLHRNYNITSSSEIAKILGTNVSYVARLIKQLNS